MNVFANISTMLLNQLPVGTEIDECVVALGNGTSSSGLARAAAQRNLATRIVGFEPPEAAHCFLKKYGRAAYTSAVGHLPRFEPHECYGTGAWGVEFPNLDLSVLDEIALVPNSEWRQALTELHAAGHAVGHTSAACYAVVKRHAAATNVPRTYFSIFYDTITKY